MRTMHLFAGIGGGLLADLILGHTPIIAVEWDKYACQVLRERAKDGWFPNLQVWEGDVRMFDPSEYAGRVDCIHAGFPCQDISNAGKQAGVEEGTRSGLYREVLRIAGVVRPKYLFLENVSAILSVGLGTVLGDLASRGYDARWLCIKASDVGANHRRDRWFLLGYSKHPGLDAAKVREGIAERDDNIKIGAEKTSESAGPSEQYEDVADTNGAQQQGEQQPIRSIAEHSDISFGSWWKTECLVGRVSDGDTHRVHRLKGLGNAQVPLQAAVAFSLLYEGLE